MAITGEPAVQQPSQGTETAQQNIQPVGEVENTSQQPEQPANGQLRGSAASFRALAGRINLSNTTPASQEAAPPPPSHAAEPLPAQAPTAPLQEQHPQANLAPQSELAPLPEPAPSPEPIAITEPAAVAEAQPIPSEAETVPSADVSRPVTADDYLAPEAAALQAEYMANPEEFARTIFSEESEEEAPPVAEQPDSAQPVYQEAQLPDPATVDADYLAPPTGQVLVAEQKASEHQPESLDWFLNEDLPKIPEARTITAETDPDPTPQPLPEAAATTAPVHTDDVALQPAAEQAAVQQDFDQPRQVYQGPTVFSGDIEQSAPEEAPPQVFQGNELPPSQMPEPVVFGGHEQASAEPVAVAQPSQSAMLEDQPATQPELGAIDPAAVASESPAVMPAIESPAEEVASATPVDQPGALAVPPEAAAVEQPTEELVQQPQESPPSDVAVNEEAAPSEAVAVEQPAMDTAPPVFESSSTEALAGDPPRGAEEALVEQQPVESPLQTPFAAPPDDVAGDLPLMGAAPAVEQAPDVAVEQSSASTTSEVPGGELPATASEAIAEQAHLETEIPADDEPAPDLHTEVAAQPAPEQFETMEAQPTAEQPVQENDEASDPALRQEFTSDIQVPQAPEPQHIDIPAIEPLSAEQVAPETDSTEIAAPETADFVEPAHQVASQEDENAQEEAEVHSVFSNALDEFRSTELCAEELLAEVTGQPLEEIAPALAENIEEAPTEEPTAELLQDPLPADETAEAVVDQVEQDDDAVASNDTDDGQADDSAATVDDDHIHTDAEVETLDEKQADTIAEGGAAPVEQAQSLEEPQPDAAASWPTEDSGLEVEFAVENIDPQAGETARMLLDIMSKPQGAAQPQERALAADTLLRLVPKVPVANLISLSERICMMEKPPALLVNKLLRHPRSEVAGPLLEGCSGISDQVLLSVIASGDRDKQRMIARRRALTPTMCDELIEHGDASVFLTIVRNPGASLSHDCFVKLSDFAKDEAALQAPLVTRGDTPAPIAFELFWFLPSELRRYVLSRFLTDSETLDKILKITMAVDGVESGEPEPQQLKQVDAGQLQNLVDQIENGAIDDAIDLLSKLAGINKANATRIIADKEGEPITVAFKAIGFPRNEFSAVIERWRNADSIIAESQRPTTELQNLFDSLSFNKARMLLTYWDWASDNSGPYALKAA